MKEEKIKWIDRTNKGIKPTKRLIEYYFVDNEFEGREIKKIEILKVRYAKNKCTSGKLIKLKIIPKPIIEEFDSGWFQNK
jgi:hypothetical protein